MCNMHVLTNKKKREKERNNRKFDSKSDIALKKKSAVIFERAV